MIEGFRVPIAAVAVVVGMALSPAASAGLGEGVDSIARDHAVLRSHGASVTPMQAYDLHESVTANGTTIRQYASRGGTVFAVSFSGRTMPDLHALLGTHYADYAAALTSRRTNHKVLAINSPGLVMEVIKLPRGFAGSAHVPALLPDGVSPRELR